jgi:hypothetical protein
VRRSCLWALVCCGLGRGGGRGAYDDDDDESDDADDDESGSVAARACPRRCGPLGCLQVAVRAVAQLLCRLGRAWCGPAPRGLPWAPAPPPPEPPGPQHPAPQLYPPLAVLLGALPPAASDALLRFSATVALAATALGSLQLFVWRASLLARVGRRTEAAADAALAFGEDWWCDAAVARLGLPHQVLGVGVALGGGGGVSPCATWFVALLLLLLGPRLLLGGAWPLVRAALLRPLRQALARLLRGPSAARVHASGERFKAAVAAAELAALAGLGKPDGARPRQSASTGTAAGAHAEADNSGGSRSARPVFLPFSMDGSTSVSI